MWYLFTKWSVCNRIQNITFLLHINSGYRCLYDSNTYLSGNRMYPHQNFTILKKYSFLKWSHKLKQFLGYGKIKQILQLFIIFILSFIIILFHLLLIYYFNWLQKNWKYHHSKKSFSQWWVWPIPEQTFSCKVIFELNSERQRRIDNRCVSDIKIHVFL